MSTHTEPLPENNIFMLNAADPASLYDLGIEALKMGLPSRLPGTHLVYKGSELLLVSYSLGKKLEFRISEQSSSTQDAVDQLKEMISWGIVTSIRIEEVNGNMYLTAPGWTFLKTPGLL